MVDGDRDGRLVPRERFSYSETSLESILANTPSPFDLLYIDGGSPPPVDDYLRRKAAERQFRLIRTEHFLSPNAARNLAAAAVRTNTLLSSTTTRCLRRIGWRRSWIA